MKVEVWSDYVCPFCYIGKRNFEGALKKLNNKDIEVVYKSFELDVNANRDGNPSVYEMLATKYGMSREQAMKNTSQIAEQAKTVGLDFYFDRSIQTNTFDAHRLTHYAASQGKHLELTERLLKAYFTDSLHIGEHQQLADLAAEIGLDREDALAVLKSDQFTAEVRTDEEEARQLGARGVPFFVINRKYAISGAQPSEVFVEALTKAWNEDHPLTMLTGTDEDVMCTDDGCAIPEKTEKTL